MQRIFFLVAVVSASLAPASIVVAQEHKINRSELPAAVEQTVKEQSKGATIKGFAIEMEHGKKFYEVEMEINGRSKDLQINVDGTLNEVEEEVAFDSLPANIQSALNKKAVGGKITKVESLARKGKIVSYEATVSKGATHSQISVSAS